MCSDTPPHRQPQSADALVSYRAPNARLILARALALAYVAKRSRCVPFVLDLPRFFKHFAAQHRTSQRQQPDRAVEWICDLDTRHQRCAAVAGHAGVVALAIGLTGYVL